MRSPRSHEQLYILPAGPARLLNSYLLADTVLDSGLRWSGPLITRALRGATVRAPAPSHARFDHGPPVCDPGLFADRVARLAA
ncbi:MAG TPA: hypothetical protein VGP05_20175 [Pseudonocardia sp.]|nr:hypothetical protein [Pseudonocardia sp.]